MKTTKFDSKHTLLALAFGGFLAACGTTAHLQNTPTVAAAQGSVKVKSGDNGNHRVKLDVKHLAPVNEIRADASTYVVWIQPEGATTAQNMGALQVDKDREAKLETVTPYKKFDLFVTAEPSTTVAQPTGERLLRTRVN